MDPFIDFKLMLLQYTLRDTIDLIAKYLNITDAILEDPFFIQKHHYKGSSLDFMTILSVLSVTVCRLACDPSWKLISSSVTREVQ
jgi:hypothetical protein